MFEEKGKYLKMTEPIKECSRCRLAIQRNRVVVYRGNPKTDVFIVAEAPGYEENIQGLPMVGKSGQLFIGTMEKFGMTTQDSYFLTNLVYCRPPDNRDPRQDEIDMCSKWLFFHLDNIKPKVVVTVGRLSTAFFLPDLMKSNKITTVENKIYDVPHFKVKVIPIRHPAAIMRNPQLLVYYDTIIETLVKNIKEVLNGV
jgi:uracil-DNA glycosylase